MKKITRRTIICVFLALILAFGAGVFTIQFLREGNTWAAYAANEHLYHNGMLASGTIKDNSGVTLAEATDNGWIYHDNSTIRRATLHAVGDAQGKIGVGAITAFADKLSGYNLITGARTLFPGGRQIWLTIDAELCSRTYDAMNGLNGCVGMYNYNTGEILCMVSSPTFDPNHPEAVDEDDPDFQGVYLNRFLSSTFIPGSTFKLVTVNAALNEIDDVMQRTFTCTGSQEIGNDTITCAAKHGEMNLQEALTVSCNCVFGQLAVELGSETMERYAEACGLTDSYNIDGIPTAKSTFNFDTDDGYLAWSGVGQGYDMVNPCALMIYTGAIANNGQAAVPHLISKVTTEDGLKLNLYYAKKTKELIDPETATLVNQMMRDNVTLSYGSYNFSGLTVGAKTGTAESDLSEKNNAWFTGFVQDEAHPYAFVVYLEGGGSGISAAMRVASAMLEKAIALGY